MKILIVFKPDNSKFPRAPTQKKTEIKLEIKQMQMEQQWMSAHRPHTSTDLL